MDVWKEARGSQPAGVCYFDRLTHRGSEQLRLRMYWTVEAYDAVALRETIGLGPATPGGQAANRHAGTGVSSTTAHRWLFQETPDAAQLSP